MEKENAFAVIREETRLSLLSKIVVVCRKNRLIVGDEAKDIFDIAEKRIASVQLKKRVLKVMPKGNVLVSFSGFEKVPAKVIGGNGKEIKVFGTIETKKDVTIISGNGRQTIISQSPSTIASCHPHLETTNAK
jgi:hypothetical protein